MNTEQAIRERSYFIWEREGRPEGRNVEHWLLAESEVRAEPKAAKAATRGKAQPAAAAKAAPSARKRAAAKAS